MIKKVLMRYPSYLTQFKCIADKCDDNCCRDWEVYIDKNTYDMYGNISDESKKIYIMNNIFKRKKITNENSDYGQIKFELGKYCPFLNDNKLCGIVTEFGDNYLSCVCRNYPRIINKIDKAYEISLDISCIEAAKIILLNKDKITFKTGIMDIGNFFPSREIKSKEMQYSNYQYTKQIRDKSIEIIQNCNCLLSDKMYILGIFIEKIRKTLCYSFSDVVEFINTYNIENQILNLNLNDSYLEYMMQISFFKNILEENNFFKDNVELFEIISKAYKGFKLNENKSIIENKDFFKLVYEKNKEIMKNYDSIFENYIINYMFNELFPFDNNDIIFDGYIMLVFRVTFIKFCIVGSYLYDGYIDENHIVGLMQKFSKEVEHNSKLIRNILIYIKENEYDKSSFAKTLLL